MQKTKTVSETGIAKNITNFARIISAANAHGTAYAPSYAKIKLPAITALHANAQAAVDATTTAQAANNHAITARDLAFKNLNPTVTKAINLLAASGVPAQTVAQARTIVRKLTGQRADNSTPATNADGTTAKRISVSQMSYDNRVENFSKFIEFLSLVPEYAPNEANLSISGLKALHDTAEAANIAVLTTNLQFSNARSQRDTIMYQDADGLVVIAQDVKNYIKAIFGVNSIEFKQLSALSFTSKRK
jgi:hypothetical protein